MSQLSVTSARRTQQDPAPSSVLSRTLIQLPSIFVRPRAPRASPQGNAASRHTTAANPGLLHAAAISCPTRRPALCRRPLPPCSSSASLAPACAPASRFHAAVLPRDTAPAFPGGEQRIPAERANRALRAACGGGRGEIGRHLLRNNPPTPRPPTLPPPFTPLQLPRSCRAPPALPPALLHHRFGGGGTDGRGLPRRARSGQGPACERRGEAERAARAAQATWSQAPPPSLQDPDLFGQVHPAVATEAVECTSCGRKVAAGRFAPHLEKCLGQGRQASRLGHRRDDGWG